MKKEMPRNDRAGLRPRHAPPTGGAGAGWGCQRRGGGGERAPRAAGPRAPPRLPEPDYRQLGQVKTIGSMPIFFAKTSATGDGRKELQKKWASTRSEEQ